MTVENLYPTHTCFDDALDLIVALVQSNPQLAYTAEIKLVHAVCKSPSGVEFAHAWVERWENMCYFAGIIAGERGYYGAPKSEFYTEYNVQETTKYTVKEAYLYNRSTGHYGPWKKRYQELCGKGDRKILT